MNPFKQLAAALAAFVVDFRKKMNPLLAQLQPLEQQEVSDPIKSVLRAAKWAMDDADEMANSFDGQVAQVEAMLTEYTKTVGAEALTAAVEAKTHLPIESHNELLATARTEAKEEGKKEVEADFNSKLEAAKTVFTRRADAIAKVGADAAAVLSDDDLAAEDHADRVAVIEARLATLKEAGISAESKAKVFNALLAHGVDADGVKAFDDQLEILKEAAGGSFAASATEKKDGPKPPSGAAPVTATGAAKKSVI